MPLTRHLNSFKNMLALSVAVILFTACRISGGGIEYELSRGIIDPYYHHGYEVETNFAVSDSVYVGEPVLVGVATFGDGCRRMGTLNISVDGLQALVEPYDSVCIPPSRTRELRVLEYQSSFVFNQPGHATVWFMGLIHPEDTLGAHKVVIEVFPR